MKNELDNKDLSKVTGGDYYEVEYSFDNPANDIDIYRYLDTCELREVVSILNEPRTFTYHVNKFGRTDLLLVIEGYLTDHGCYQDPTDNRWKTKEGLF